MDSNIRWTPGILIYTHLATDLYSFSYCFILCYVPHYLFVLCILIYTHLVTDLYTQSVVLLLCIHPFSWLLCIHPFSCCVYSFIYSKWSFKCSDVSIYLLYWVICCCCVYNLVQILVFICCISYCTHLYAGLAVCILIYKPIDPPPIKIGPGRPL